MVFVWLHNCLAQEIYYKTPPATKGSWVAHKQSSVFKENMRDLLYKNLTSADRTRRVIASSEITDKEGVHSVVRRHFSCMVKQVEKADVVKPAPYLYVLKERDTKQKREHFFCKIKGSILSVNKEKFFLIIFVHTLSIQLTATEKLSGQIG